MEKIDIIIVTYNAGKKLEKCLNSVIRHTRNFDYLITVVDNNAGGAAARYLKKYKDDIRIIRNKKNLGFPKAANIGIRNTKSRYIVFLDDDARVTRGWLGGLFGQIKRGPKTGIAGGKVVFPDGRISSADYIVPLQRFSGNYEVDRGQRNYLKKADALSGACWLMRRAMVAKVGYFDERFFPCQSEDIDYCLRARLAGYSIVYNGKVTIVHDNYYREAGQSIKNRARFMRKWGKRLSRFPLRDSHPVDRLIADGVALFERKRFNQALIKFKKTGLMERRFYEPFLVGKTLEAMGRYAEAAREFKTFLKLNDWDSSTYCHLGFCYEKLGKTKIASRLYLKSLYYKRKFFPDRQDAQCIKKPI